MDPNYFNIDPLDINVPPEVEEIVNEFVQDLLLSEPQPQRQRKNLNHRPRTYVERNREEGHTRLFNDYFSEHPVYTEAQFRRRFRMRKHVFLRIVEALGNHDDYFQQKVDATGRMSLSPLQKCTAGIRMLVYGSPADAVDEYVRLGETTAIECLERFVNGVCEIFGPHYLRRPNNEDIQRLLQIGEARGFPGMLGSIDCMHWEWKNCPVALQGQYHRGDHSKPTIILEAVASQDLWIWHAYFGTACSNNDINVLNQSDVFNDVLQGNAPQIKFHVNGNQYNYGYYLADDIYPEWATFVKSILMPRDNKKKLFARHQEAARKDVERAFGVLQSRFAIVRDPGHFWHVHALSNIIYACVILHNMIVEDEQHAYDQSSNEIPTVERNSNPHPDFAAYIHRRATVQDRNCHHQLQADLVDHIWDRFGHTFHED